MKFGKPWEIEARDIAQKSGMLDLTLESGHTQRFEQEVGDMWVRIETSPYNLTLEGIYFWFAHKDENVGIVLDWGFGRPQWSYDCFYDEQASEKIFAPAYLWLRENSERADSFVNELRPHTTAHERLEWQLEYAARLEAQGITKWGAIY